MLNVFLSCKYGRLSFFIIAWEGEDGKGVRFSVK